MLSFGELLRRHRLRTLVLVRERRAGWRESRVYRRQLSQNELGRRAGVDASLVHMLEKGRQRPRPETLERLIAALELDDFDAATLRASAGYWPLPDLDDDEVEAALAVLFAVGSGDWRPADDGARQDASAVVR